LGLGRGLVSVAQLSLSLFADSRRGNKYAPMDRWSTMGCVPSWRRWVSGLHRVSVTFIRVILPASYSLLPHHARANLTTDLRTTSLRHRLAARKQITWAAHILDMHTPPMVAPP